MWNRLQKHISVNSPVILGFTGICLMALILGQITGGVSNTLLFSVYRASLLNPLTYVRLVGHIFGHAGWEHFSANITMILLVGPLLEEKYGSRNLLFVMLATAVITGAVHMLLFPHTALLGASGVVFAFIILSSFTGVTDKKIPLTFIVISAIYLGGQIYDAVFVRDNISNLTHILGGVVGGVLGFRMNRH